MLYCNTYVPPIWTSSLYVIFYTFLLTSFSHDRKFFFFVNYPFSLIFVHAHRRREVDGSFVGYPSKYVLFCIFSLLIHVLLFFSLFLSFARLIIRTLAFLLSFFFFYTKNTSTLWLFNLITLLALICTKLITSCLFFFLLHLTIYLYSFEMKYIGYVTCTPFLTHTCCTYICVYMQCLILCFQCYIISKSVQQILTRTISITLQSVSHQICSGTSKETMRIFLYLCG